MGSIRLPGKMMMKLGGEPLLKWVLERVLGAQLVTKFFLATSTREDNDDLVDFASTYPIVVIRGSETDVVSRFDRICTSEKPDAVIRVCADNPFVCPVLIDELVEAYIADPCDYICNHRPIGDSKYSDGFGAELLGSKSIIRMNDMTKSAEMREHVTQFVLKNKNLFRCNFLLAPSQYAYPELKFDVDTEEDLRRLDRLVKALEITIETSALDIISKIPKVPSQQLDPRETNGNE